MRKTLIKRILLTAVLSGIVLFPAFFFSFSSQSSVRKEPAPVTPKAAVFSFDQEQKQIRSGLPIRLSIPKIKVDTTLEYAGLTPEGDVGVPTGPFNASWYDLGPRPGEKGNAIITGHYGWKNGIPAVFDNLYKLRKGDKIYIEDETGTTTVFVVRESRRYDPKANASYVFISNDMNAHLNLITCEGVWNKAEKSYSKRLVVFADKEIK
jgi:LPXTG-site transpeptidase (sortase) family protein